MRTRWGRRDAPPEGRQLWRRRVTVHFLLRGPTGLRVPVAARRVAGGPGRGPPQDVLTGTVAGLGVGIWPWGGRVPSSTLYRERRWGWGSWGGGPSRDLYRLSELRDWPAGGTPGPAGDGDKGSKARCSCRIWVFLVSLTLVFLTSLFFSVSLRGGVGFNYLEAPGWEESRRVKLVPSYAGAHRPSVSDSSQQKTCECPRCVGDPGVSDWFDENYDPDVSPVWTRDNGQLPPDVFYWWVVSMLLSSPVS